MEHTTSNEQGELSIEGKSKANWLNIQNRYVYTTPIWTVVVLVGNCSKVSKHSDRGTERKNVLSEDTCDSGILNSDFFVSIIG